MSIAGSSIDPEREANNPETIECLWLVKNGVPFDVAFSLSAEERMAWVVIFGRFEGNEFDWQKRRWKERR